MSLPERWVRALRLRASSDALARRGQLLCEDALRTASLPAVAAGRVLIIRKLALGGFAGGSAPTAFSRAVEVRLQELAATAVHGEESGAATASAVFFRDELEPCLCLALRLARREDVSAWFWRCVLPGWVPAVHRHSALRQILERALELPAGPLAAAVLVARLHEYAALDELLGALRCQDGSRLLRASGWSPPPAAGESGEVPQAFTTQITPDVRQVLDCWSGRWGLDDARSLWLAAVLLVHERPTRLLQPDLPRRARRWLSKVSERVIPRRSPPEMDTAPRLVRGDPSLSPEAVALQSSQLSAVPARTSEAVRPAAEPLAADELANGSPRRPTERGRSRESAAPEPPLPTAGAGLLFLVPVLARLGIAEWLAEYPDQLETELPVRLLQEVAGRLRIPDDDPLIRALLPFVIGSGVPSAVDGSAAAGRDPKHAVPLQLCLLPSAPWQDVCTGGGRVVGRLESAGHEAPGQLLLDSSGRLPLALWRGRAPAPIRELAAHLPLRRARLAPPATDLEILLHAWLTASRRWCRRHARVGLHDLVSRPGRVRASRTHIDIFFDLRQADIRVRRAGLDLDPGWVPWLGRVIHFHYRDGEPSHA